MMHCDEWKGVQLHRALSKPRKNSQISRRPVGDPNCVQLIFSCYRQATGVRCSAMLQDCDFGPVWISVGYHLPQVIARFFLSSIEVHAIPHSNRNRHGPRLSPSLSCLGRGHANPSMFPKPYTPYRLHNRMG